MSFIKTSEKVIKDSKLKPQKWYSKQENISCNKSFDFQNEGVKTATLKAKEHS